MGSKMLSDNKPKESRWPDLSVAGFLLAPLLSALRGRDREGAESLILFCSVIKSRCSVYFRVQKTHQDLKTYITDRK
jgi:hypothetical protein